MKPFSSVFSGASAVVVLLAFFLPWITISCGSYSESYSGYDLAQGPELDESEEPSSQEEAEVLSSVTQSDASLWLIPLAAGSVLVAAGLRKRNQIDRIAAAVWYGIAGGVALVVQIAKFADIESDFDDLENMVGGGMISLTYEIGFWLSFLGIIAILIAVIVAREEREGQPVARPGWQSYFPGLSPLQPGDRPPGPTPPGASSPEMYYNLGVTAAQLARRDEARQHFMQVLGLNPHHVAAWLQLANLADTPEQAWDYIQQARSINAADPAVVQAVSVIWPQVAAGAAAQQTTQPPESADSPDDTAPEQTPPGESSS